MLVALSGGKDSVCLLRLLCARRDEGLVEVCAAHMEHGIRGDASAGDMEFCRQLCEKHGVPFRSVSADVPRLAEESGEGLETCARRVRHAFLQNTARELGCDYIALAHHRRDRAETLLMHLLRGSSLKGMASMGEMTGEEGKIPLVRPLIDVSPEQIQAYLEELGQPWREDETNLLPDNPRNALRLKVLPLLKEIYPGAETALCRFGDICAREDACLDRLSREYASEHLSEIWGVRVLELGSAPFREKALVFRALKLALPFLDCSDMERIFDKPGFTDAGQGVRSFLADDRLYILPPAVDPGEKQLSLNGETVLPGICRISVFPCESVPIRDNGLTQRLNAASLEGACLRLRRENDFIRPFGMAGKKSLGDYMTDRRVPLPVRDRMPLLARGSELIWLPGVGISENARVRPDAPALECSVESL